MKAKASKYIYLIKAHPFKERSYLKIKRKKYLHSYVEQKAIINNVFLGNKDILFISFRIILFKQNLTSCDIL